MDPGRKRAHQHIALVVSFFFILIFAYITTKYTSAKMAAIISIAVIIYLFTIIIITTFWNLPGYREMDKRIVKYSNWEEGTFFLSLSVIIIGMFFFEPLLKVQLILIILTVGLFPGSIILFLYKNKAVRLRVTSNYEVRYIKERPNVSDYITSFIILIGFSIGAYALALISSYNFLLISILTIIIAVVIGMCQEIESIILFENRRFQALPKPLVTFKKRNLAYFIYLLRVPIAIVLFIVWININL